jgi:hypothetical protein
LHLVASSPSRHHSSPRADMVAEQLNIVPGRVFN